MREYFTVRPARLVPDAPVRSSNEMGRNGGENRIRLFILDRRATRPVKYIRIKYIFAFIPNKMSESKKKPHYRSQDV
jgi:hypothetical protein